MKPLGALEEKNTGWFEEFLAGLPLAVLRESLDGQIVYCNDALAELFGFNFSTELIERSITPFYRNAEDHRSLVETVIHHGRVRDVLIPFTKRDGTTIWCSVTERAVLDRSGRPAYLDGFLREITEKRQKKISGYGGKTKELGDFKALLDPAGTIVEINPSGAALLGFTREDLVGKPIFEYVVPCFRDLFSTFLAIVAKTEHEEGILTIMNRQGEERHLEFYVFVDESTGMSDHIHLVARNVTERIKLQKEQLLKEKFLGILEMAGGVAHKLNQPLTVIRNTATEVLSLLSPEDPMYDKIVRIHLQIERIHEVVMKIGNIKRYEAMDYVAGIKIVDIDKTS